MRDLVFLATWLALFPLAFRGPQMAVLLWVWTSLLGPNDLMYGVAVSVPFAKLAALPTLYLLLLRRGAVRFRLGAAGWLLLALAVLAVVSQATTAAADPSPGWDLCQKFLKIIALALVVLWVVRDRMQVHALLFAMCLGIGYIAVDEGAKFILSGSGHKILGSPSLGDNNQIALDVLLIIPLLSYLHETARSRLLRLVCLAAGLLSAVTVIASFSRGGFAGLVIVGFGLAVTGKRKWLSIGLLATACLVGAALVGSDWTSRMSTMQTADNDDSFMGRVGAWKVSTVLALERPFQGGGFHAIQHRDVWLSQAQGFKALSLVPSGDQGDFPRAAHSIYFEILGDLGFGGLGLFLSLFAVTWHSASSTRSAVRHSGRADLAWAASLATKLQVSLLVFLISGGLLSAAYYDVDYLLVALTVANQAIVRRTLVSNSSDIKLWRGNKREIWARPTQVASSALRITKTL